MKVAVAYIPVVHKGHQEFSRRAKPDILYILGNSFLKEFAILERDIRALCPEDIALACRALALAPEVKVLEKDGLADILKAQRVILANDEIVRQWADKYLSGKSVKFEPVFLRWDKMAAVTAHPVVPDMEISRRAFDLKIMGRARKSAGLSSDWWRQVGSVIVKNGKAILSGYNRHTPSENSPYIDGDPRANLNAGERPDIYTSIHGEASLIAQAARKGISLEGASLYATTFPCPNCARLIIESGMKTVYYADGYSNLSAQDNFRIANVKIIQVKEK